MNKSEMLEKMINERKEKLRSIIEELEEIILEITQAEFEEDMYFRLSSKNTRYKEQFEDKRQASDHFVKKLEKDKEKVEEAKKILECEIEYIESQLK